MLKINLNKHGGYSLMEVMLAIGVFTLLAILVTQSVAITLKSAKKSDASTRVRADLDYAVNVMERKIRNADSITNCTGPSLNILYYVDKNGEDANFQCIGETGDSGYVASTSEGVTLRLTSEDIKITNCNFGCIVTAGAPDSIEISITGEDKKSFGGESSQVSVQTKVILRTY
jgi:Tfp pilus assembly protein PilW